MLLLLMIIKSSHLFAQRYIRGSGLAYGAYVSLDLEAGLLNFSLYRVSNFPRLDAQCASFLLQSSNSTGAYKEASTVLKGLVDGSVSLLSTRSWKLTSISM